MHNDMMRFSPGGY